jgi:isoleucyl-tRNA synthetase
LKGIDLAEIAITSGAKLMESDGPKDAFRLDDVPGVAVVFAAVEGKKCARSWKILPEVGTVPGQEMRTLLEDLARGRYRSRLPRSFPARRRGRAPVRCAQVDCGVTWCVR